MLSVTKPGFLAVLLLIFVALPVFAGPDAMQFKLIPPDRMMSLLMGYNGWTIDATGPIDEDAPRRLSELVKTNGLPPTSMVFFNSPGGSLMAGMELGKIIRANGFDTYIGAADAKAHEVPGDCFSACTLAFLGGVWRYAVQGSHYGVHRFYFTKPTGADADAAQMISAVVVQFMRDMGASSELFSEMTRAGRESITILPEAELERLNVVNNGVDPVAWSVESAQGIIYLKGQQDSTNGFYKFILGCDGQRVALSIFLPQSPASDHLPPMGSISLVADGKYYPLDSYLAQKPQITNGRNFVFFYLPPDLVRVIASSQTVGVIFQVTSQSPTFFGFNNMNFTDGAPKLPGALRGCFVG